MGIITKGMGAILKGKLKPKYYKEKRVSNLEKSGRTTKVKNVTLDSEGRKKTSYRYVGGPLTGFSTKPYMPRKRGQGKLFREKYQKPKKNPKQLKFKFPPREGARTVDQTNVLKQYIKKSEVK